MEILTSEISFFLYVHICNVETRGKNTHMYALHPYNPYEDLNEHQKKQMNWKNNIKQEPFSCLLTHLAGIFLNLNKNSTLLPNIHSMSCTIHISSSATRDSERLP